MMKKKPSSVEEDYGDLISISEAARVRGVSHAAIQDLIKRGKLSTINVGGRRLLRRSEVDSFKPEPIGRPLKAASKKGKSNKQ